MKKRKSEEHRAEMEARKRRRAERAERTEATGPSPRRWGPKKTTTDVTKTAKAKAKQDRRALRRLEEAARTREGKMKIMESDQWRM